MGAGRCRRRRVLGSSQSNPALTKALQSNASRDTWVAATVNSNNAAGYQLASGEPVMAIGGFNGTDPAPTLAQFEKYVSEGKIHYFIGGGTTGAGGGSGDSAAELAVVVRRRLADHVVGRVPFHFEGRRRRDDLRPELGRILSGAHEHDLGPLRGGRNGSLHLIEAEF